MWLVLLPIIFIKVLYIFSRFSVIKIVKSAIKLFFLCHYQDFMWIIMDFRHDHVLNNDSRKIRKKLMTVFIYWYKDFKQVFLSNKNTCEVYYLTFNYYLVLVRMMKKQWFIWKQFDTSYLLGILIIAKNVTHFKNTHRACTVQWNA